MLVEKKSRAQMYQRNRDMGLAALWDGTGGASTEVSFGGMRRIVPLHRITFPLGAREVISYLLKDPINHVLCTEDLHAY